jgi:hypothetical protein
MDDNDTQDWGELARAIQLNTRGANDYWYWKSKDEMETGVAQAVLSKAGLELRQLRSRGPGQDPPDCEAMIGGLQCGIEVTELVDRRTLEASIRGSEQWLVWDQKMLCRELQRLIDRKDKREKVKGGPYDRYILVVVTDESLLGRQDVTQFLAGATFRASFITEVYLGLSYDPWVSACPVFRLELVQRDVESEAQL